MSAAAVNALCRVIEEILCFFAIFPTIFFLSI